jgi:hypothetical protein
MIFVPSAAARRLRWRGVMTSQRFGTNHQHRRLDPTPANEERTMTTKTRTIMIAALLACCITPFTATSKALAFDDDCHDRCRRAFDRCTAPCFAAAANNLGAAIGSLVSHHPVVGTMQIDPSCVPECSSAMDDCTATCGDDD